jgi:3'-5' exonuclease
MAQFNKIIFDIETVGVEFDSLDATSQEYLIKGARTPEEAESLKDSLSFSPLTGQIITIALFDPDANKGVVYFQAPGVDPFEEDGVKYVPCTEKEILENFWRAIGHYRQFVTFNGRSFDCPYIMVRSAVLEVAPSKNLMPNRYYDEHIDLYDRLGFFGAVRRTMSLHMWCQAFGIKSSKDGGISGHEVAKYYKEGKHLDIARYCFDDVRATNQVYQRWEEFINIK